MKPTTVAEHVKANLAKLWAIVEIRVIMHEERFQPRYLGTLRQFSKIKSERVPK